MNKIATLNHLSSYPCFRIWRDKAKEMISVSGESPGWLLLYDPGQWELREFGKFSFEAPAVASSEDGESILLPSYSNVFAKGGELIFVGNVYAPQWNIKVKGGEASLSQHGGVYVIDSLLQVSEYIRDEDSESGFSLFTQIKPEQFVRLSPKLVSLGDVFRTEQFKALRPEILSI